MNFLKESGDPLFNKIIDESLLDSAGVIVNKMGIDKF